MNRRVPASGGQGPLSVFADRVKYKLYGLVFLLVIALFCALSVAFYTKAFEDSVSVLLKAKRAGLQMSKHADVKIRGVIVGEVTQITSEGALATLHLSLRPDEVRQIPANVKARLLPKTLFGQKYVSLVTPAAPTSDHIRSGEVISEDRSKVAMELNRVFNDVLPLLRSIEPVKLNATLHAIASALRGRGDRIGQNLSQLESYLQKLNPSLPTLKEDISLLADFAETYSAAAPDLLRTLDNLTFTSRTVVEERQTLDRFLHDVTTASGAGRHLLATNKERLIQVNAVNRPTLELLARYSPEFPCLLKGLAGLEPRLEEAFGGGQPGLHITLELVKPRQGYQYPEDLPKYGEDRGPYCYGMPDDIPQPFPDGHLEDGAETFPEKSAGDAGTEVKDGQKGQRSDSSPGQSHPSTRSASADRAGAQAGEDRSRGRATSGVLTGASIGSAGAPAEQRVISHLIGPVLGKSPSKVSDVGTLLFGPMARGTLVQVR